jgi:predicted nucleic acid-binding Zn ribbon protein
MPTYIYETIPEREEEVPRRFELKQSMNDAALTHEPGTGIPVRRVITGGLAPIRSSSHALPTLSHTQGHSGGCCGSC